LGTLADGLGCFPLDNGAYPPLSHWLSFTLVFRVCLDLVPLSQPAPKQCFTPSPTNNRCASTHFGENQLAPSSIGISPLTTPLPPIFQHRSVRTSTWFYPSFILDMVRSPGFGSINSDILALFRLAFALASAFHLNPPLPITRRLILQQAHGQPFNQPPIACQLTVSCSFSLPSRGSFHLSLAVLCAIGHIVVFSLTGWSRLIH
jgi:hypothetical protein